MPKAPLGISQDKHGHWWTDFRHDGRRIKRIATSRDHALSQYRALKSDLERGQAIPRGARGPKAVETQRVEEVAVAGFTLSDLRERYLKLRSHIRALDDARRQLERFEGKFPDGQLATALRAGDIDAWLHAEAERTSPSTANRALHTVRAAFRLALRDGLVEKDPTFGVKSLPEPPPRSRYMRDGEEVDVSKHMANPARPSVDPQTGIDVSARNLRILLVAIWTGLRRGNLFGMRWDWIDWAADLIMVPNTKNGRRHPLAMNAEVRAALEQQRAETGDSPWVWPSRRRPGEHLDAERWVKRHLKKALKAAGIEDFRFHDLRHTTGSRVAMAGLGAAAVRDVLAHSSVQVSNRYMHLDPKYQREAVEAVVRSRPSQKPSAETLQKTDLNEDSFDGDEVLYGLS